MKLKFEGKTKTVYELEDGNYQLFFKDDMTGADGVFDPGANSVGVTVDGAGKAGLKMSTYFFRIIEEKGCPTHFVDSDIEKRTMTIKPVTFFGKGLEVICRFKAMGSFIRRYGSYVEEGTPLDSLVEMTLKDDMREDPTINQDTLEMLGILKEGEYEVLKDMTQKISGIIKDELAKIGLELCDIKLEFGRDKDGTILLIDEVSGGNMRVLENGKSVSPLDLTEKIVG